MPSRQQEPVLPLAWDTSQSLGCVSHSCDVVALIVGLRRGMGRPKEGLLEEGGWRDGAARAHCPLGPMVRVSKVVRCMGELS